MNTCLNCNRETNNNKFCSISCQLQFQNEERCSKRYGAFKNFRVKCAKCGNDITIEEREKLFPQKKKYYCSRGCANSRVHSDSTKEQIRRALKKDNFVQLVCKQCGKEFAVLFKNRRHLFCSRSCAAIFKNSTRAKSPKKPPLRIKQVAEKNTNKLTFIYALEYPEGNIRYIGKSDSPQTRLKNHIQEAKQRNKNHRDKWINSLSELPFLKIIEETTYGQWQEREMFWIKYYKDKGFNLVNGTNGGEGSNGFKGRTHTIENRKKFSENRLGEKTSQETKDKLSGENSGRCKLKDDEVRNIFRLFYNEQKSTSEISKKYNINKHYINQMLSGKKRKKIFNEFNKLI